MEGQVLNASDGQKRLTFINHDNAQTTPQKAGQPCRICWASQMIHSGVLVCILFQGDVEETKQLSPKQPRSRNFSTEVLVPGRKCTTAKTQSSADLTFKIRDISFQEKIIKMETVTRLTFGSSLIHYNNKFTDIWQRLCHFPKFTIGHEKKRRPYPA